MKIVVVFVFLVSTAWAFPARAQRLFEIDRTCACDPKAQDFLEEPIRFAFGKFQGQCVDSCRFRRARILRERSQEIIVGNVLHLGKFVRARIRLDEIESVQAGFERFAPGVDHVFLLFSLLADAPLRSQDGRSTFLGTTRRIVLSSEGVAPKGHDYSLSEGYQGHYLLDHRLVTGEEMAAWIGKLNHPLRLVTLNLSGAEAARLLARGIERSDAESFESSYQLFRNNCSTSALSLLDWETGFRKLNWDPLHWEELEAALPIAGPFGTAHALAYRGLVKDTRPGDRRN